MAQFSPPSNHDAQFSPPSNPDDAQFSPPSNPDDAQFSPNPDDAQFSPNPFHEGDFEYVYDVETGNLESILVPVTECVTTDVPASVRTRYPNIQNASVTLGSLPSSPYRDDSSSRLPSTSQSDAIPPPTSPHLPDETPTQDDFDPKKFDATNLSFMETYDVLSKLDLDKHIKFIRDTILKYSLNISDFPACHDEDLMMAVYFYFEKHFKIQAKLEFCARFDYHNNKNLVGVLLDSIHTKEEILKKADKRRCTDVRIRENFVFHWILNGYNGPRRRR